MGQAEAKIGQPLTTQNLHQLLMEFRRLQLEVAEMKATDTHIEEEKHEKVTLRYQLYYRDGYLERAREVMADGLAAFLKNQSAEWLDKDCSFSIINPDLDDGGWGAIRLEVVVYSISGLITLRKIMKAQLETKSGFKRGIRTTKPTTDSKLYSVDAEAKWRGKLKDSVAYVRLD